MPDKGVTWNLSQSGGPAAAADRAAAV